MGNLVFKSSKGWVSMEQDNTLTRLEFLDSLIQNKDDESEYYLSESPSSRREDILETSMVSKCLVVEAVDVTTSKNSYELDPTKHSTIVFRVNQEEPNAGSNPGASNVSLVQGK